MENCNSERIFITRLNELMKGKSVNEYAKKMGVFQQSLDSYLKGRTRPSIKVLVGAAYVFGVSTDWLLGLSDEREQKQSAVKPSFNARLDDVKRNAKQATESFKELQSAIEKLGRII